MMLKFYKFGFGRATDLVNEAIRAQKITRDQGIELIEKYDGVCDDSIIASYCRYTGISEREFWDIANNWVNTNIFTLSNTSRPLRRFKVGIDYAS